jgi:hypothetical protein
MLRDVDVLAYARRDTLNRGPMQWTYAGGWSVITENLCNLPIAHVVKARLTVCQMHMH